jgi:hypothetical protein
MTEMQELDSREQVVKRLEQLLLFLEVSCTDELEYIWPSGETLSGINNCIVSLIGLLGKKRPRLLRWNDFARLNRRKPSLRLVPRIDRVVKRAIEKRMERCGLSALEKAAQQPDSQKTECC